MHSRIFIGMLILLLFSFGMNIYLYLHSGCVYETQARIYPNPTLTPGAVFPEVTAQDICTPGYTAKVRSVSKKTIRLVFQNYGIKYPPYEVDHFIPLELGGSNDIENLWPEPAEPHPGFHEKDKVENRLHHLVCDGKITLVEAQEKIKKDWYGIFKKQNKE